MTIINKFFKKNTNKSWKDNEYFDHSWKERIKLLSSYIDSMDNQVCDVGCGMQWLRDFLPKNIKYIPVDYVQRSDDTIVCDLNQSMDELNKEHLRDVIFLSGVLEYIENLDKFIEVISVSNKVILSYCSLELYSDENERSSYAWKNSFRIHELIQKFLFYGFVLEKIDLIYRNHILMFRRNRNE